MEIRNKCPLCNKMGTLLPSNNPLMPDICSSCAAKSIDASDLKKANLFCRTLNIPFNPELWMKMYKELGQNLFKEYVYFYYDDGKREYKDANKDLWEGLNKEWSLIRTHEELISKLKPVKDGYMLRNQIKWGSNYTFEELIALESLFTNTLKANDVSNPMQKDAIKKSCKMSIALDRAIVTGDSKEINELSKAYQNFVKTAKIDDLITASSQDVIANVAQLVQYIEDQNFQMDYYDNVDRDIVDKSLKDMQNFIQRLVADATGLDIIHETIRSGLKKEESIKKDMESYEKVPLEVIFEMELDERNKEFDEELERDALIAEQEEEEEEYDDLF